MSRPVANIDRNLTTCRASLKREVDPERRDLIQSLIDDLLSERVEATPHCSLCQGKGKALPNGVQCAECDRRRCNFEHPNGEKCPAVVENIYAKRCPLGHILP